MHELGLLSMKKEKEKGSATTTELAYLGDATFPPLSQVVPLILMLSNRGLRLPTFPAQKISDTGFIETLPHGASQANQPPKKVSVGKFVPPGNRQL